LIEHRGLQITLHLDLAHRIDVRTGDELEKLGEEFNQTAARLEESYANLERRIAERTRDLMEALQRLTALAEVGRAVNSTLELQAVLNSIVVHAGPLAGADGCAIYEYDEATQEFHLRATHNYDPALVASIGASPLRKGEGVMGRAAEQGDATLLVRDDRLARAQVADVEEGEHPVITLA
jgi:nitrate/nitrite-specific signal transduction histidine kinase